MTECRIRSVSSRSMDTSSSLNLENTTDHSIINSSHGFSLLINGKNSFPYVADSGTDITIICRSMLRGLDVTLSSIPPIKLSTAFEKGTKAPIVTKECFINLTLSTKAGSLNLSKCHCLVVDQHIPEVLLGQSLLKGIGIDVNEQLSMLATTAEHVPNSVTDSSCDPFEEDVLDFPSNESDEAVAINEALLKSLQSVKDSNLPKEQFEQLSKLVLSYKDIFRLRLLATDEPVKVKPYDIKLKANAPEVKLPTRRYPAIYQEFMSWKMKQLVDAKMVYVNSNSRYCSPAHIVPKVNPPTDITKHLRYTTDYKKINSFTEPQLWPMPALERLGSLIARKKYFCKLDLINCYWQFACTERAGEILSTLTHEAVYSMLRLPQGSKNAVPYVQSSMEALFFERLLEALMIFIDDLLLYAATWDEFIDVLTYVFDICRRFNLRLHAEKCEFLSFEVKYCGRLLSADGVRQDPSRIQALIDLNPPTLCSELLQFLCSINWFRLALPDYSRLSQPLYDLCQRLMHGKGRTKKIASSIPVSFTDKELECYNDLKALVAHNALLNHLDPNAELFLMADASSNGWGSVVFQIPNYDDSISYLDQNLQPLAFLGGLFRSSSFNWHILCKEAFSIIESLRRLNYLFLSAKRFRILTDHRNLIYLFNPSAEVKLATTQRLQRWSLMLQQYNYTIDHVPGDENKFADLLSRFGYVNRSVRVRNISTSVVRPLTDVEFIWPSLEEIKQHQALAIQSLSSSSHLELRNDLYYFRNAVWIPEDNCDLKTRLLVIAHSGASQGHRGSRSTLRKLQSFCNWSHQSKDVDRFCSTCLLCLQVKGGRVIPRPLGRTLVAEKPAEVLHLWCYFPDAPEIKPLSGLS